MFGEFTQWKWPEETTYVANLGKTLCTLVNKKHPYCPGFNADRMYKLVVQETLENAQPPLG